MTTIEKIEELNCLDRLDYSESESKAFYNAKHKAIEILRAETVIKCEWKIVRAFDDEGMMLYESKCGHRFDTDTDYKYCPFCGKLIERI